MLTPLLALLLQVQVAPDSLPAALPAVTITAPKPSPTSSTQTNISAKALDPNTQATDVPEALRQLPAITAQSDAGTGFGYSYFRLRGLEATRTTISLDGVPLSEPEDQGMYFSNLPAFIPQAHDLTLTRGSAPGASGLTSYAGALDFSLRLPLTPSASFSQLAGSFETYRSALSLSSGLKGPWAFGLDAVKQSSQGYRDYAFNKGLGLGLISLYTTPTTTLKASFQTGQVQNGMAYLATPLSLLDINPRANILRTDETDSFKNHLGLVSLTHQLRPSHTVSAAFAHNIVKGFYDLYVDPDMLNFQIEGATTTYKANYAFKQGPFALSTGVLYIDAGRHHRLSIRPDLATKLYENYGARDIFSHFTNTHLSLGRFTLGADLELRQSQFVYTPSANAFLPDRSITWRFANPHLWVSQALSPTTNLKLSVGQSYREPTRTDLFAGFDNLDSTNIDFVGPLTGVRPERVQDFELSLAQKTKSYQHSLTLYHLRFQNEIAPLGPLSYIGLPLRKNVDRSFRQGLELSGTYNLPYALSLTEAVSFQRARIKSFTDDALGETFTNTPPLLAPRVLNHSALTWSGPKPFSLTTTYDYQSRSFLTNTGDSRFILPASHRLDLSLTYALGPHTLSLLARNLTATRSYTGGYTDYIEPYYFKAPPRSFYANFKINF